jgi:benzoyl-CoA reductase/2-hydroxyglutaryl-CoA dehydratase subunit BcrC/BadD/HgdB
MNNRELPPYLDEIRERLQKTGPLKFMDGSEVYPEEIFETHLKSLKGYTHYGDPSFDYTLANAFKHRYLQMTIEKRAKKMREKGMPVLFSFWAFPDLIIGSGGTLIGPVPCGSEISLADNLALKEEGHRFTSFESCPMEPAIALYIRDGKLPVDLTVYMTGMADVPCILNLLRRYPDIPLFCVCIPYSGKGKPWALEYLADQLHTFVQKIGEIRGSRVTDEELRNGIRMMNQMRRSFREYIDIFNSAETPPIAGLEYNLVKSVGSVEPGDPVAIRCANEQLNEELRERVRKGIIPPTMRERPLRIYVCGLIIVSPPAHSFVESLGGIFVGPECFDADFLSGDVDEKGDPYEAVARWWLEQRSWSSPCRDLEERTEWLIKTLRRYNPDGVICAAIWGCQMEPPYARYLADKIEEKLGIPTMLIDQDDIPDVEVGEDGRFRMKGDTRTRIEGFMEILHARR